MNCISIALFPSGAGATVKRVIEYFCPGDDAAQIWVDIFVENPTSDDLTMKVLHEGSLIAKDVTLDSWTLTDPAKDPCAVTLTRRITELHEQYCPITQEGISGNVSLDGFQYRLWTGTLKERIGNLSEVDAPFTLWTLEPILRNQGTVIRLCLKMRKPTLRLRIDDRKSFLAYGEAIVLRNIRDRLQVEGQAEGDQFQSEFASFKGGHKVPEAFEYLIVSPDGIDLRWDAVALSPLISSKFIPSGSLARTTRWFATDSPYIDSWRLKGDQVGNFILTLSKPPETFELAGVRD